MGRKARANIFKHKHEIETGRTSDISREILGFDSEGKILNYNASRAPSSGGMGSVNMRPRCCCLWIWLVMNDT